MTHLQNADLGDKKRNQTQIQRFEESAAKCSLRGLFSAIFSFLQQRRNTDHRKYEPEFTATGIGHVWFKSNAKPNGNKSSTPDAMVNPPLQVKTIQAGERVSYGGHFVAERTTRIAVLPVGYADGYRRSFEGKAHVLIQGRRAPVVGTVCMDLCMIDVTDFEDVTQEDEVVLMGSQGEETISTYELARWADTIAYEITCGISDRVPASLPRTTPC